MKELVKVQETLDQVLDYLAGNDIGLVAEHLRTNIDKSKSIVENLLIYSVVRPNLTDKHPIKGVNETMQVEPKISKSQVVCDGCGDVGVRYITNVGNYCFFCDPT